MTSRIREINEVERNVEVGKMMLRRRHRRLERTSEKKLIIVAAVIIPKNVEEKAFSNKEQVEIKILLAHLKENNSLLF